MADIYHSQEDGSKSGSGRRARYVFQSDSVELYVLDSRILEHSHLFRRKKIFLAIKTHTLQCCIMDIFTLLGVDNRDGVKPRQSGEVFVIRKNSNSFGQLPSHDSNRKEELVPFCPVRHLIFQKPALTQLAGRLIGAHPGHWPSL